jgi:hypothetical protein
MLLVIWNAHDSYRKLSHEMGMTSDMNAMNDPLQDDCPFKPALQKYWRRLSTRERKMQLDEEALYSLDPQEVAMSMAQRIPGATVIDACCGAGGMSIALARCDKRVVAIERDAKRLAMAQYNARLFDMQDRIDWRAGDSLLILPTLKADAAYLDPAWGGPAYIDQELMTLASFEPHFGELIRLSMLSAPVVVCKIPVNFDFKELEIFGRPYERYEERYGEKLLFYSVVFSR